MSLPQSKAMTENIPIVNTHKEATNPQSLKNLVNYMLDVNLIISHIYLLFLL